jgi:hypothetical protein
VFPVCGLDLSLTFSDNFVLDLNFRCKKIAFSFVVKPLQATLPVYFKTPLMGV